MTGEVSQPTPGSAFDSGISTLTPEDLAEQGWHDNLEMLEVAVRELARRNEDPDNFEPDERIEHTRNRLLAAADASRTI